MSAAESMYVRAVKLKRRNNEDDQLINASLSRCCTKQWSRSSQVCRPPLSLCVYLLPSIICTHEMVMMGSGVRWGGNNGCYVLFEYYYY